MFVCGFCDFYFFMMYLNMIDCNDRFLQLTAAGKELLLTLYYINMNRYNVGNERVL